jgi:hypothetical protein
VGLGLGPRGRGQRGGAGPSGALGAKGPRRTQMHFQVRVRELPAPRGQVHGSRGSRFSFWQRPHRARGLAELVEVEQPGPARGGPSSAWRAAPSSARRRPSKRGSLRKQGRAPPPGRRATRPPPPRPRAPRCSLFSRPQGYTPSLKPNTLNPKPQTLKPNPKPLNPARPSTTRGSTPCCSPAPRWCRTASSTFGRSPRRAWSGAARRARGLWGAPLLRPKCVFVFACVRACVRACVCVCVCVVFVSLCAPVRVQCVRSM